MTESTYAGSELDLFAEAREWKEYWSSFVRPFITGDVLEVGAGIGSNTSLLDVSARGRWVCLEPDAGLAARLTQRVASSFAGRPHEVMCGTLSGLHEAAAFDTVIYIDVLEHIEDDRAQLTGAAMRLRAGGRLIVLVPAHQRLFTPFDRAIGHYRRYSRSTLRYVAPAHLRLEQMIYLDSVGLALSLANLLLLRQAMPTMAQLRFWNRHVIPISRVVDRAVRYSVGKSILAVWRNERG